jgi:putative flippase GtrA
MFRCSTPYQQVLRHWLRFNVVGGIGLAVQVLLLAGLLRVGLHYLGATAIAVEAALLQNFAWHERWTWRGRGGGFTGRAVRLWRFHMLNGLVSIVGNVAMMRLLVGTLGAPALPANLIAVVACSTLNFFAARSLIWVAGGSQDQPYQPA